MSPFALTTLALLLAAAIGYGIGHIVAGRHATKRELAEFDRGHALGVADGGVSAINIAAATLAHFPTSIGGRAIAKALGCTVPPLPRARRVEVTATGSTFVHDPDGTGPSTSATALVMLDAGEGPE